MKTDPSVSSRLAGPKLFLQFDNDTGQKSNKQVVEGSCQAIAF